MVEHVTEAEFEEKVLKADKPVLVDFWAEWCAPCRMIAPFLDEIDAEMGDKVKVVKVNIDEHPNLAARYGVRGIPTLMIVKDGEVISQQVGAAPKSAIASWVESAIANA
ncbi:thioredoxin [Thermopetrobacter sp. TC1]|uniref:thioredoxin n=1 Tax=Thermopetrobacter sp. TC1 TaxID=1495045 RepID=UPI00057000E3|nr:thioredoxin [Thermopetrobacter sp. TC1]